MHEQTNTPSVGRPMGFTLIELMIVIAIIGILAAVAVPNFISYRNKSFCSQAETDVINIAGEIAEYFSVNSRTETPDYADLRCTLSGNNTASVTGADPNSNITIIVTDGSGRCPEEYQKPSVDWGGVGMAPGIITKYIKISK